MTCRRWIQVWIISMNIVIIIRELNCTYQTTYSWSGSPTHWTALTTKTWGNGKVDKEEAWDDGDTSGLSGWNPNWSGTVNGWSCTNNGPGMSVWTNNWGDSILTNNEAWDDGNKIDGDGWSSACVIEASYACSFNVGYAKSEWAAGAVWQNSKYWMLLLRIKIDHI